MATFIHKNNEQLGPFDDGQVLASFRVGVYSPDDLAWREGMAEWQPLRNLYPSTQLPPPLPARLSRPEPQPLGDDAGMRMILPVGRSGWAIAAGYLGLFALVVLPAPLALLISIIAIWDIRRTRSWPHPKRGMGRAIFGLVTGILGTAFLLIIVINHGASR